VIYRNYTRLRNTQTPGSSISSYIASLSVNNHWHVKAYKICHLAVCLRILIRFLQDILTTDLKLRNIEPCNRRPHKKGLTSKKNTLINMHIAAQLCYSSHLYWKSLCRQWLSSSRLCNGQWISLLGVTPTPRTHYPPAGRRYPCPCSLPKGQLGEPRNTQHQKPNPMSVFESVLLYSSCDVPVMSVTQDLCDHMWHDW